MKLKYEFNLMDMDGEIMAVPKDGENAFRGILRMNDSTAFILGCLGEDTTEDIIVKKMQAEYDADEDTLRRNAVKILDMLRADGLIED